MQSKVKFTWKGWEMILGDAWWGLLPTHKGVTKADQVCQIKPSSSYLPHYFFHAFLAILPCGLRSSTCLYSASFTYYLFICNIFHFWPPITPILNHWWISSPLSLFFFLLLLWTSTPLFENFLFSTLNDFFSYYYYYYYSLIAPIYISGNVEVFKPKVTF